MAFVSLCQPEVKMKLKKIYNASFLELPSENYTLLLSTAYQSDHVRTKILRNERLIVAKLFLGSKPPA